MLNLLLIRRSCRKFEDKAVEAEKKGKLLQAAWLGSTGKNTRPWGPVVAEKREILQKLGNCRQPNQPFLPRASLVIVVLGNIQKADTWIGDALIAAAIMQLEAEKLGLGSY